MANTKNSYEERLFYWNQFMSTVGKKSMVPFKEYVKLANSASIKNGYVNRAEQWKAEYEIADLEKVCLKLWIQVKPLYLQIFAYVRRKLKTEFGKMVTSNGPIPSHILGISFNFNASSMYTNT